MADLAKLVGARIRQVRKSLGMTQEQLGELAQLQSSYIGGVERGERNISLQTLEKIISALNISVATFFKFGHLDSDERLDKDDLIEVFISDLMTRNIRDIRKIYNIYREIYDR